MKRLPPFVQRKRTGFRGWAYIDGKRRYGPTRSDPLVAHRDAIALRESAASEFESTITLGHAVKVMLEEMRRTRSPGHCEFTESQWKSIFQVIPRETRADRLTGNMLRHLIHTNLEAGRSAQTILHYRSVISRLYGWLRKRGQAETNPSQLVDWPRPEQHVPDVIPPDELRSMLERVRTVPEDYDLVILMAYTGLRRSEVARCEADHFDLASNVLWIRGKRRKEALPLDPDILPSARRLVERGGFVVPGTTEHQRKRHVANLFRRWSMRFRDRRFHAHALRHSLATMLIRAGVHPSRVQQMMRHSSYQTTQRYIHLIAEDLRAATATLRLVPKERHG